VAEERLLGLEEDGVDGAIPISPARSAAKDAGLASALALDGLDDVEEADRGGRSGEPVPAAPAGLGLDEAGVRQIAHDLREEAMGDRHPLGDPAHREPAVVVAALRPRFGQGEHGSDGVVAPARQLESHGCSMRQTPPVRGGAGPSADWYPGRRSLEWASTSMPGPATPAASRV
jgi:hypothetical protein